MKEIIREILLEFARSEFAPHIFRDIDTPQRQIIRILIEIWSLWHIFPQIKYE